MERGTDLTYFSTARILLVMDQFQGRAGYELTSVMEALGNARVGNLRFHADWATRGRPTHHGGVGELYPDFRFDMRRDGALVLDSYDQLWLIGDDGPESSLSTPADDAELTALAQWMGRGGGVFATGGEDAKGSALCSRIPRVRAMRRWINSGRFGTMRGGSDVDVEPQPIECVQNRINDLLWLPHPVLAHPDSPLLAIDVMPDSNAEGSCFDNGEANLNLDNEFTHEPEFPPTANGTVIGPKIIAYGSTLGSPSFPARRFPMISVYDGFETGVGRIITDSSSAHWRDLYIQAIKDEDGPNWRKIRQYYINVATWLCPGLIVRRILLLEAMDDAGDGAQMAPPPPPPSDSEGGRRWRAANRHKYSDAWLTDFAFTLIREADWPLFALLNERYPTAQDQDDQSAFPTALPPLPRIENVVLGAIARTGKQEAAKRAALGGSGKPLSEDELLALEQRMLSDIPVALARFASGWRMALDDGVGFARRLGGEDSPGPKRRPNFWVVAGIVLFVAILAVVALSAL